MEMGSSHLKKGSVDSIQKIDLRGSEAAHVVEIFGEDRGRVQEHLTRGDCVDFRYVTDEI
jgi:hypothetical protein